MENLENKAISADNSEQESAEAVKSIEQLAAKMPDSSDKKRPLSMEKVLFSLTDEQLADLFKKLKPREKTLFTFHLGLEDGRKKTIEEVSAEFGITRSVSFKLRERLSDLFAAAPHELKN